MSTDENREKNDSVSLSSAAQFRERRIKNETGEKLTLASDLVILIKKPKISKLLIENILPANVASNLQKLDLGGEQAESLSVKERYEVISYLVANAVITPTVRLKGETADYDKGEISIDDLDDADYATIVGYVLGGTEKVNSFRTEPERDTSRSSQ